MTREVIIDIENPKDNDLISRDAVLDLVADYDLSMGQVVKGIHALPPVTPQPKVGHWTRELIRNEKGGCIGAKMLCSECGNDNKHDEYMNYCPNCGIKMQEGRMNKEDTKQAILGFTEFFKGITGNQDLKIPDDIAKEYEIEQTRCKDTEGTGMTREEAIEILEKYKIESEEDYYVKRAEAIDMAIKALEKDQCGDCIDRKIVMECFVKARKTTPFCDEQWKITKGFIEQLPPVTPQPNMGHWEWNQYDANPKIGNFHCSLCHSIGRTYFDYCPYCGAKMSEIPTGTEGSDKECMKNI